MDAVTTRATLPELVAGLADQRPDAIYLQDASADLEWTYAQVHEAGLMWAGAYAAAGVGPGDRVLTMLSTRAEYLFSWLGLSWLRVADVPINTEYRGAILHHVGTTSAARILILEDRFLPQVVDAVPQLEHLEQVVVVGDQPDLEALAGWSGRTRTLDEFLGAATPLDELTSPGLHDLASVLFTSGTTGPSKGVMQPWGQLRRNVLFSFPVKEFGPDDAFYLTSPIYHQAGKFIPYLVAMGGGRFVFREKFSASEYWPDVRRFGCTWAALIGVMAPFLLAQEPGPDDADNPLCYVSVIPMPADVEGLMNRFGVEVTTVYGMTEISVPFSSLGYRVSNATAPSCGRQTAGCEVRIVDELDYEVPEGEIGELIVRADEPWVMNLGYLGMPEATVEAWRNGWFHTGDAFRRDAEGFYYFIDRMKDSIRRRGENISSLEVEAIVNTHPAVTASAAIAAPSEYNEDEVKICVVLKPHAEVSPEDLIAYLIPRMPRFMVPRYIEFVEDLPRTPTQRIQKVELRKSVLTPKTWDRVAAGIDIPRA